LLLFSRKEDSSFLKERSKELFDDKYGDRLPIIGNPGGNLGVAG
jgi:hypothetical protein